MNDWIVKSLNFNFLFSKVHPKFSPVAGDSIGGGPPSEREAFEPFKLDR